MEGTVTVTIEDVTHDVKGTYTKHKSEQINLPNLPNVILLT